VILGFYIKGIFPIRDKIQPVPRNAETILFMSEVLAEFPQLAAGGAKFSTSGLNRKF